MKEKKNVIKEVQEMSENEGSETWNLEKKNSRNVLLLLIWIFKKAWDKKIHIEIIMVIE